MAPSRPAPTRPPGAQSRRPHHRRRALREGTGSAFCDPRPDSIHRPARLSPTVRNAPFHQGGSDTSQLPATNGTASGQQTRAAQLESAPSPRAARRSTHRHRLPHRSLHRDGSSARQTHSRGGGGGPPTTCAVCSEARRRLAWSDKAAAVVREGPADTWKARCTEALVPETGSASRQHSRPAAQTQRTAWKELASYLGSALGPGSLRFSPVMRTVLALPSAGARDVSP